MRQRKVIDAVASGVALQFGPTCFVRLCVLMLGCVSLTAQAQKSAEPIEACSRVTNPGARLACFDHAVQQRRTAAHGTSAVSVGPAASTAPTLATGTAGGATAKNRLPDDTIGLDGRQLILERKEEGIRPKVLKPIVAAIARLKPLPGHQYYFELDNGQVWESTDTEPDLFLGPHETVLIRPGVLGAFFLKTQEGNSIRVHRLR